MSELLDISQVCQLLGVTFRALRLSWEKTISGEGLLWILGTCSTHPWYNGRNNYRERVAYESI